MCSVGESLQGEYHFPRRLLARTDEVAEKDVHGSCFLRCHSSHTTKLRPDTPIRRVAGERCDGEAWPGVLGKGGQGFRPTPAQMLTRLGSGRSASLSGRHSVANVTPGSTSSSPSKRALNSVRPRGQMSLWPESSMPW